MSRLPAFKHGFGDSALPAVQGVCWLFGVGIVQRLFELHPVVNVIGFAGLGYGFWIGTRRYFARKTIERPPQDRAEPPEQ